MEDKRKANAADALAALEAQYTALEAELQKLQGGRVAAKRRRRICRTGDVAAGGCRGRRWLRWGLSWRRRGLLLLLLRKRRPGRKLTRRAAAWTAATHGLLSATWSRSSPALRRVRARSTMRRPVCGGRAA